ncbi:MAG: DUF2971 domain-containing protein [Burkholderiales bacterium]
MSALQTACERNIDRLYRFQRVKASELKHLFRDGLLRLSDPRYLNDPWDCRPQLHIPSEDDQDGIRRVVKWMRGVIEREQPDYPPEKLDADEAEMMRDPWRIESTLRVSSEDIVEHVRRDYRILCVTTNPLEHLLWAHYADSHRGVCIIFDATQSPIDAAMAVDYSERFPTIDLSSTDDALTGTLLSKASFWKYEDEYRLIARERRPEIPTDFFETRDSQLIIDPRLVVGVILGCRISERDRCAVLDAAAMAPRRPAIFRAEMQRRAYELELVKER